MDEILQINKNSTLQCWMFNIYCSRKTF